MSEMMLTAAFGGGLVLGTIFYGGLWWTVKKGIASHYAGWWFPISLLLRLGVTVEGFYLVAQDDWKRLITCLAGFLVARIAVTLLTKEPCDAT